MASPIGLMDKPIRDRAVNTPLETLLFVNRELMPAVKQMFTKLQGLLLDQMAGSISFGPIQVNVGAGDPGTLTWATPPTNGWIYIRTDGGAGTTLYVFEGGAWAGK